jgi:hypothetical protein
MPPLPLAMPPLPWATPLPLRPKPSRRLSNTIVSTTGY